MWHIESAEPQPPFLLASAELADTTTSRLLATWMSLSPTLQVRPLGQRGTTRLQHRPLLHIEMEPSPWPGLATSLRGKRLSQPMEDCCKACARDQFIESNRQTSLEGTTYLRLIRKGNCEVQTSWCCLDTELNTCAKIKAEFRTHMDTALSRMSWTLISKSCP